mmetsp:Transcript_9329/g.20847  ORF Transcript_9329/g.20847 Transcript_9329/m.20847 type:complete len:433 (-) Transcript_9329:359-1657(-)
MVQFGDQSLPICIGLSAVGGIIEVLATAILAYQDDQEKEGRIRNPDAPSSRRSYLLALTANVTLQIIASVVGNMIAPWFGPVSIVGPMFLSAQLLANMVIFGYFLGLEMFSKDMKVGTYVIVAAAVLLPSDGPQPQDGQDVTRLLSNWYSLTWSAVLLVAMFASSFLLVVLNVPNLGEAKRFVLLITARCTAFAINLSVSRVMILDPGAAALITSIILKVLSGAVMTHAIIVQSTAVVQAKFVPLNASVLILINGITGMIIWEDWRSIGSPIGYACVFVLLLLGNFLLLGEIELFESDSPHYGLPGTVQRFRLWARKLRYGSARKRSHTQELTVIAAEVNIEEGRNGESSDSAMEDESSYVDEAEYSDCMQHEPPPPSPPEPEPASASPKQAWTEIYYGLDGDAEHYHPHRRRHIFFIDDDEDCDGRTGMGI